MPPEVMNSNVCEHYSRLVETLSQQRISPTQGRQHLASPTQAAIVGTDSHFCLSLHQRFVLFGLSGC